jgi:hypothetical protein
MKIALLRRGERDSLHVRAWIEAAGIHVIDICSWEQVQLMELNYSGTCKALFEGIPVEAFDLILNIGTPGQSEPHIGDQRDLLYRNFERSAALLAVLSSLKNARIINRGYTLLCGKILVDPIILIRGLIKVGWKAPIKKSKCDLHSETGGDSVSGRSYLKFDHPANLSDKKLVVYFRSLAPVIVGTANEMAANDISAMMEPTRRLLDILDLDYLTIATAREGNELVACGARIALPASLSKDAGAKFFASLIE